MDAATGATWSGHQIEIASDRDDRKAEKPASSFDDEVQEVIDAVTGATWGTRNRIMEDMFHKRLDQDASSVPLFAPRESPVWSAALIRGAVCCFGMR